MELVSQASLLAAQTERSTAPGTAADRARLRTPADPGARAQSVDRRADQTDQRSFPVDQLDIRSRVEGRPERDLSALKSASSNSRTQPPPGERASQRQAASEQAGVGRRESPLAGAPERTLPPGSHLNITA